MSKPQLIDTPLLAAAKAKGKRLGRPRVVVDAARIAALRVQGRSWRDVRAEMRLTTKGTAQRAYHSLPKNLTVAFSANA